MNEIPILPGPGSASELMRSDLPPLIPYCATCELPVELFGIDDLTDQFGLNVRASCHGSTTFVRLSAAEVLRVTVGGGRLTLFKPRGRAAIFPHLSLEEWRAQHGR